MAGVAVRRNPGTGGVLMPTWAQPALSGPRSGAGSTPGVGPGGSPHAGSDSPRQAQREYHGFRIAEGESRPYGPCRRRGVDRTTAHRDHVHLSPSWSGARM